MRLSGGSPLLRQSELAWLLLWLICVAVMVTLPDWQVVPFDAIWISLGLLYGFNLLPGRSALALTATAIVTTAVALGDDMIRHLAGLDATIGQIPLLATLFVVMAFEAHRRMTGDRSQVAAERLLLAQRQFLQDASHQLRTPITIALGHAELLAGELAGRQLQRDINVVVGELERLRMLSDRLLLISASANPDFLNKKATDLDVLVVESLHRWQPTARRRWQLGKLDPITALVDAERLAMAIDALVENAVKHTGPEDLIQLAVIYDTEDNYARIIVEDSGDGIASADVPYVFDRFRTAAHAGLRGTGLGLALVKAIASGHGGQASVRSSLGLGSRFQMLIPVAAKPVGPVPTEPGGARAGYAAQQEAS